MFYTVTYHIESNKSVEDAAHSIIYGQSIGNPSVRSVIEQSENVKSLKSELLSINGNEVKIKFPKAAWTWPNISQLLCIVQGGQSDIKGLKTCQITSIDNLGYFNNNHYGNSWLREKRLATNRPLVGAIVKPKSGLNKDQLLSIVEDMIVGGADFIKEDEIMADNNYLPLKERVQIISELLDKYNSSCIYTCCINADPIQLIQNLELIKGTGLGVHINFWSGFGSYTSSHQYKVFTHFQRSGVRAITNKNNPYAITWPTIVDLMIRSGIDSIHLGMLGGYYPDDEPDSELIQLVNKCNTNNVIPILSCGMNPTIAKNIKKTLGNNFLANCGGWLHTDGKIRERMSELRDAIE